MIVQRQARFPSGTRPDATDGDVQTTSDLWLVTMEVGDDPVIDRNGVAGLPMIGAPHPNGYGKLDRKFVEGQILEAREGDAYVAPSSWYVRGLYSSNNQFRFPERPPDEREPDFKSWGFQRGVKQIEIPILSRRLTLKSTTLVGPLALSDYVPDWIETSMTIEVPILRSIRDVNDIGFEEITIPAMLAEGVFYHELGPAPNNVHKYMGGTWDQKGNQRWQGRYEWQYDPGNVGLSPPLIGNPPEPDPTWAVTSASTAPSIGLIETIIPDAREPFGGYVIRLEKLVWEDGEAYDFPRFVYPKAYNANTDIGDPSQLPGDPV